ncbi:UDP-glucose 4-epimerase GalE [Microvirga alba]|uniref:UDP-glucose 4-epimerase n=1 Tax=Microvirga alba TaxID=2791025 RepID=A0A931BNY1_9HYPH|nr:UDP-glucose 4-epimerase GalE [Microvirga alba]MBF9234751.1 UDP-glucose 4-epimerase GalE [Microvirga alba]
MTVLVTGGAGYIGSHMVLELIDAGEQVIVLDDLSTGFRWSVPPAATLVIGDAGDQALVSRLIDEHGIDSILHFAAKIVVPESVADPLAYYLNNVVKSRALIETAVAKGIKSFIFSSTATVYGNAGASLLSEDLPVAPINPYGRTKVMTEWMLEDTCKAHGLRYAVLRYFNVAGADPKGRSGQSTPRATHLIKVAAQVALGRQLYFEVLGTDYDTPDGTCVRDYVQVNDLAHAHLVALRHLREGGESIVLNCGYGHGASVLDVIKVVKEVSGVDFEVRISPRRGGDPARLVAKVDRIRGLGWQPKYDNLADIVAQALRWERFLADRKAA